MQEITLHLYIVPIMNLAAKFFLVKTPFVSVLKGKDDENFVRSLSYGISV